MCDSSEALSRRSSQARLRNNCCQHVSRNADNELAPSLHLHGLPSRENQHPGVPLIYKLALRLLLHLHPPPHTSIMSLFGSAASTAAANTTNQQGDLTNDIALTAPPEDGISDLCFSSQSEHLAVASWDKKVRIYEIAPNGQSQGKAMYEHDAPVFAIDWSKVGSELLCASF